MMLVLVLVMILMLMLTCCPTLAFLGLLPSAEVANSTTMPNLPILSLQPNLNLTDQIFGMFFLHLQTAKAFAFHCVPQAG